ncbi:MAG TPA: tetratricopeptide repeat protein [Amycolatopsis sp.]|uniref:tetratricopeptide repeat protein n=1 Tax=Amycolatopsis sp. TaxID=37632 RepID=UPI002B497DE6|nr:tetratricopeptide repeat protein [Amycolatopsis sp.]HKS47088.1 tetratricopeptide repeat protein [Amycolatopsis sp.]
MGETTFGAELRNLRHQSGMSLTELARRVHYTKGYLSRIETGAAAPNRGLALLCEAELGAPGALTALLPAEPIKRRTRPLRRPSNLPVATTTFSGRRIEQERIKDALAGGGAVCVVSGLGGTGKTALAVRAAYRLEAGFAGGCLFADLRGHTPGQPPLEPFAVQDQLLRLLGVPGERIPTSAGERNACYQAQLRGHSFLLVFDNAVDSGQVRPLLPAEPKCRVLVTSRARLTSLDDACFIQLDVLSLADATALFASLTGLDPADPGVAEVVSRCGRLPLAIRIAAARLRAHPAWDVGELCRRLADEASRLEQLDDGERSLTATLELSIRHLDDAETRLLGLLALHPGIDFDVHSMGALANVAEAEADRLAERLHNANLLTQPAKDCYATHDLVRAFAGEFLLPKLPERDRSAAFGRLVAASVRTAALADRLLIPDHFHPAAVTAGVTAEPLCLADEQEALGWFQREWPTLVALCLISAERGEPDRCWQLAFLLRGFFFMAKLWDPWVATHRAAQAAAADDQWALATTTANLGVALANRGDFGGASVCYREALALHREIGDSHGESTVLAHCAWVDHYLGDHTAAVRNLRQSLGFYERTGNRRNVAITTRGIALALASTGQHTESVKLATEALVDFDDLGLDLDAAMALNCLGWTHFLAGDHERATRAYERAAARALRTQSPFETARAYIGLGNVAAAVGAPKEADWFWHLADETHQGINPLMVGEARVRSGN